MQWSSSRAPPTLRRRRQAWQSFYGCPPFVFELGVAAAADSVALLSEGELAATLSGRMCVGAAAIELAAAAVVDVAAAGGLGLLAAEAMHDWPIQCGCHWWRRLHGLFCWITDRGCGRE
jgi:hypothetical protein